MARDAIQQTRGIWRGMKQRCLNPKSSAFRYYGGRGISICQRWLDSFDNFLADMGPRPSGLSIDRIDNDGNYEPGNCRWATSRQQALNQRVGSPVRTNAEATHCVHGHPLSGDNVYRTDRGGRHCIQCQRDINVGYRKRRRIRENRPSTRLSPETVNAIRADPRSSSKVAKDHGISAVHVRAIKRGYRWSPANAGDSLSPKEQV